MKFFLGYLSLSWCISMVVSMPIDIAELEGKPLKFCEEVQSLNVSEGNAGTQYGFDVSTTISASSASCFVSSGYTFVVPRVYN